MLILNKYTGSLLPNWTWKALHSPLQLFIFYLSLKFTLQRSSQLIIFSLWIRFFHIRMNTYQFTQESATDQIQDACIKFKGRTRLAVWQRNLQHRRCSQHALQERTCSLYLILERENTRDALSQESAWSLLHPPSREPTRAVAEGCKSS